MVTIVKKDVEDKQTIVKMCDNCLHCRYDDEYGEYNCDITGNGLDPDCIANVTECEVWEDIG